MNAGTLNKEVVATVSELVRMLVDKPDHVAVEAIEGSSLTMLEVRTAKPDHGKVVGRGGRTVGAAREILVGVSGKLKHRFTLELVEPNGTPVPVVKRKGGAVNLASITFEDDPVGATEGLLARVVRLLVDDSAAVQVNAVRGRQVVVFELSVDPGETNRVIGRRGRTATALRTLLLNLGARVGRTFHLEIVEPIQSVSPAPRTA